LGTRARNFLPKNLRVGAEGDNGRRTRFTDCKEREGGASRITCSLSVAAAPSSYEESRIYGLDSHYDSFRRFWSSFFACNTDAWSTTQGPVLWRGIGRARGKDRCGMCGRRGLG
jgi:hypothetical protein